MENKIYKNKKEAIKAFKMLLKMAEEMGISVRAGNGHLGFDIWTFYYDKKNNPQQICPDIP